MMSPERFRTEFALLVTYKIRIRCKRFSDTSQIRNVLNPESKVQNLYMQPLVGVDELNPRVIRTARTGDEHTTFSITNSDASPMSC